ncbi:RING/U-box superfamily protein [Perilla frutescens var. hirtella]|nr:RING/U-box superfamily protein [Perilla frutescens var. hirtella]KAH6812074.1 RING/U-box superfamily protein [Perilla frutescens var. frutescens]KAH6813200.1 RING/U-box superfamily protein [Perilla frutescens var. frutescens]
MSTPPPPPPLAAVSKTITSISLGYAISIALGFLVFFSTVLLASYLCFRSAARRRRRRNNNQQRGNPNPDNSTENSIYLPRIIFVSEDDENESENVVVGLEQAVINSYPKVVFTKRNGNWGNDAVCSICLCEYREAEMLRMLPDCKHCFHVMCVDAWLKLNASCPVCRNSPLPTPLSTPLQEVVPLSQYADGRRR